MPPRLSEQNFRGRGERLDPGEHVDFKDKGKAKETKPDARLDPEGESRDSQEFNQDRDTNIVEAKDDEEYGSHEEPDLSYSDQDDEEALRDEYEEIIGEDGKLKRRLRKQQTTEEEVAKAVIHHEAFKIIGDQAMGNQYNSRKKYRAIGDFEVEMGRDKHEKYSIAAGDKEVSKEPFEKGIALIECLLGDLEGDDVANEQMADGPDPGEEGHFELADKMLKDGRFRKVRKLRDYADFHPTCRCQICSKRRENATKREMGFPGSGTERKSAEQGGRRLGKNIDDDAD